jgi:HAD superfamily hydrolase (TIGR01509 family)
MLPQMTRYDAVLFDFDGTLVDTMPLHFEAYRRSFAEMGVELSHDDFYDNIGGTGLETIPRFLRGRPAPLSTEEIHRNKKRILLDLLERAELTRLPTSHLLPLLHGRVPMAVATSGARVGVEKMLARLGWESYFAAVVTAEDVVHGKPAPDLFLAAAASLNVPIARCLVFEDTDDGVAAAMTAGAAVVDVRTTAAETARRRTSSCPGVGSHATRPAQ